jgi:hypothetical protein
MIELPGNLPWRIRRLRDQGDLAAMTRSLGGRARHSSRSTRCRSRRPSRTAYTSTSPSDSFDAETERLLSPGTHRLRDLRRDKSRWTTFADIEGNELDLIAG